ncbi:MAG: PPC domain-containing DNA-binding protein [Bacillota bacterium]
MKYSPGHLGRVFIAKIEHGDDLLKELRQLAVKENLSAAVLFLIGALKKASLVAGPEKDVVPPSPVWKNFNDAHEMIGIGTLFRNENQEPVMHLHAGLGRGDDCRIGCIREDAETYLVVEVIILEVLGSNAKRILDAVAGMNMLGF